MSTLPLDGTDLYYEVEGAGVAVLLIHGFALDARMWDDQVADLRDAARVIRYDARGFGRSRRRDPDVTYTHAGDAWALLDHLGVDDVVIVGLSMGGRIALETTLADPDRVRALVLIDAVLDGVRWDEKSDREMAAVSASMKADGLAAAKATWLAHGFFRPARRDPALAARLAAIVENFPGLHLSEPDPHGSHPAVIEELSSIAAPTTVIVGQLDVPCFQDMADRLATGIPGAHKVVIPDAGHMANMEAPDVVNTVLREVIEKAAS